MKKLAAAALALVGMLGANAAWAQTTPATLQARINSINWTNGTKQVTGKNTQDNLQIIHDLLAGMGTWDVNGNYTPNVSTLFQSIQLLDAPISPINGYSAPLNNWVVFTPGGAWTSLSPLGGHASQYTSGVASGDSFRAQGYFRCKSHSGPGVEETCSISEMNANDGYTPIWTASTAYTAGAYIAGGDGAIFQASANCTSAGVAPTTPAGNPASQPDGTPAPAPVVDGSCSWKYIGVGAGNNRSANLLTTVINPGGGSGWGQSIVFSRNAGAWPVNGGFGVGQEIDTGNLQSDCPAGAINGCQIYGLFMNANGTYKSTLGLSIGGSIGYHIGIQFGSTAVGLGTFDAAIADGSKGTYGINMGGGKAGANYHDTGGGAAPSPYAFLLDASYTNYAIQDNSTVATFFYLHGSHSFAGIYDDSSSNMLRCSGSHVGSCFLVEASVSTPYEIRLNGTPSVAQIQGVGFAFDPTGQLNINNIKATGAGTVGIGNATYGTALLVTSPNPAGAVVNALSIAGGTAGNSPALGTTNNQNIVFNNGISVLGPGGIYAPTLAVAPIGSVAGTVCADSGGLLYVKGTAGACK